MVYFFNSKPNEDGVSTIFSMWNALVPLMCSQRMICAFLVARGKRMGKVGFDLTAFSYHPHREAWR